MDIPAIPADNTPPIKERFHRAKLFGADSSVTGYPSCNFECISEIPKQDLISQTLDFLNGCVDLSGFINLSGLFYQTV